MKRFRDSLKLLERKITRKSRKLIVKMMKRCNKTEHVSIISSNCIGGVLSHDLGLRFESPTVDLYFSANGFLKFVSNLKYYQNVSLDKFEVSHGGGYPIAYIDDVKLDFVHYKSVEECTLKWNERRKRINYDNIRLIFTDRDGMSLNILKQYLALPYKKVVYVSKKEWCLNDECIYIPGFESAGFVGDLTKYADLFGHRYYEKYFDIVRWLNN